MILRLTFLVFVLLFNEVKCICRQSYMTFCDNLDDLKKYSVENATDLVVGNENADNSKLRSVDFGSLSLDKFEKLINLIVVKQINNFKIDFLDLPPQMEYLKLYGNEIRRVKPSTFDTTILRKVSLANNGIEYIQKGAFRSCNIKTIDLSNNKLDMIEQEVFTEDSLGNGTKIMVFTNNNLESIQTYSLPSSLVILNLDHNKLNEMPHYVFENLINLQEFTISHNQIYSLPRLNKMEKVKIIDVSHNFIEYLATDEFDGLDQLEVLDLSYNKLFQPTVFESLKFRSRYPSLQISLAFNRLTHLIFEGDGFQNHTVFLYGNPWNCECWTRLEKFMVSKQMERNECDLKFFANGEIPYCIVYYASVDCTKKRINTSEEKDRVKDFLRKAERARSVVDCSLSPRRVEAFYLPLHF